MPKSNRIAGALLSALLAATSFGAAAAPFAFVPHYVFPGQGNATMSVVDLGSNTLSRVLDIDPFVYDVLTNNDGSRVYIASSYSGRVTQFNAAGNFEVRYSPRLGQPSSMVLSPDESKLYVMSSAYPLYVLDAQTLEIVGQLGAFDEEGWRLALSADGRYAYKLFRQGLRIFDLAAGTSRLLSFPTIAPFGLALTKDGKRAFIADAARDLYVLDLETGQLLGQIWPGPNPFNVILNADESLVYVTSFEGNTVNVLDANTLGRVAQVYTGADTRPNGMAFTPDGKTLVVTLATGTELLKVSTSTYQITERIRVNATGGYAWGRPVQTLDPWPFQGFLPPLNNEPALNLMKAGAVAPIKFSVGSDKGLAIFAAGSPSSKPVACPGGTASGTVEAATASPAAAALSFDAASVQYTYLWKTDKAWSGTCRQVSLRLVDGTTHTATFKFN